MTIKPLLQLLQKKSFLAQEFNQHQNQTQRDKKNLTRQMLNPSVHP